MPKLPSRLPPIEHPRIPAIITVSPPTNDSGISDAQSDPHRNSWKSWGVLAFAHIFVLRLKEKRRIHRAMNLIVPGIVLPNSPRSEGPKSNRTSIGENSIILTRQLAFGHRKLESSREKTPLYKCIGSFVRNNFPQVSLMIIVFVLLIAVTLHSIKDKEMDRSLRRKYYEKQGS